MSTKSPTIFILALTCALLAGCDKETALVGSTTTPAAPSTSATAPATAPTATTPQSVESLRKAAEQGAADAQYNLGVCYDNGTGVIRDLREAANWYRKAAAQGHAKAQNILFFCYVNGTGVEQDQGEALRWLRKSAEQGFAVAQYNLGSCFESGLLVEKDQREAVKWYSKAADQGSAAAKESLNRIVSREPERAGAAPLPTTTSSPAWQPAKVAYDLPGGGVVHGPPEGMTLWDAILLNAQPGDTFPYPIPERFLVSLKRHDASK